MKGELNPSPRYKVQFASPISDELLASIRDTCGGEGDNSNLYITPAE